MSSETSDSTIDTFEALGLCKEMIESTKVLKWLKPTPIQQKTIPHALLGRDIVGLAETGSGKTGAFALPILHKLLENPQKLFAVCLAPTRELCSQIGDTFKNLGAIIGLNVAVIVGGIDKSSQTLNLAKNPHIIVASPGRLVDHLENTRGFSIRRVKFLVMDEADRLLSMDFEDAINQILENITPNAQRQTMLFSATMTSKVSKLQKASLTNPVAVEIGSKYELVSTLTENFLFIPFKFKLAYLEYVLSYYKPLSVIIFTDTCLNAKKLTIFLRHVGHSGAICLHGQMDQNTRFASLNKFKLGGQVIDESTGKTQSNILVATDVASRGLDIPDVEFVINVEIPRSAKDYTHRVGRTARAGKDGRALTLVTQYDVGLYTTLEESLGRKLEEIKDISLSDVKSLSSIVNEATRQMELEVKESVEQFKSTFGVSGNSLSKKKKQQIILGVGSKKVKKNHKR